MKIDVNQARWQIDGAGTWVSFLAVNHNDAIKAAEQVKDKTYTLELTVKKKKRSLNANAYMWQLCEKLAEYYGITKDEVYRNAIRDVGIFKDFPPMPESYANTLCKAWSQNGTGWVTEKVDYASDGDNIVVRCYYGSSVYNSKQMSRLVDHIVEDCKDCGIETMTPEEISLLTEAWGEQIQ